MKVAITLFAFLFFLHFASPSFAATFTFSGTPSSISDTENFSVQVSFSISSSPGTNYYIRAAFSHADSPSNYFGYTKNNSGSWYNGTSDHTQYYQITLDENNQWSGAIEIKPDIEDTGYKGSGTYNFKLGRYTEAGSGPTWCTPDGCSIASISITSSTPTPTLAPTSTSTPPPAATATPTKTPTPTSTPTKTPTPIKTPTPTKSPMPTPSRTPTPTSKPSASLALGLEASSSSPILGESTESSSIIAPTSITNKKNVLVVNKSKSQDTNLQKLLMFLGVVVFVAACGIVAFREIKKRRLPQNE